MSTPFDRTLYGYRFVLTQHGDTLQKIAARELDDAGRWAELIALNDMVYPYLTDNHNLVATGVFLTGGYITIPAATPGAETNDPNAVFGQDIALTNGQFIFVNGDFAMVSGLGNLEQALTNVLNTNQGELLYHTSYGTEIREMIGTVNSPAAALLAARYANDAVSADPRISSITSAIGTSVGNVIAVTVDAQTIQGSTASTGQTY
jgi:phage baseplate assembly protein W